MSEQIREEFEEWAEDYGHDIRRSETNPDEYHDLVTEWVFDAWMAARAAYHGESRHE